MLKRVVRAAFQRIGRHVAPPVFDLAALANSFGDQLSRAGCSGRCNVVTAGIGLVVIVTLEQTRSYNLKLLSVVARVAIEKLRDELGADIKAVYWRHATSIGIERLPLPATSGEALGDGAEADETWSERHGHRMQVTEVDFLEFESAQRANQAPVATEAQAAP
ncbi:MAG: hypothetical protein KAX55_00405 [Propionivibrio sp.]|nr:hypothetical protein [Propionivibrio sp.]